MKMEVENYFVMAGMAVMGAIGCVFVICALAGIDIVRLGMGTTVGLMTGFAGLFFALLVILHFSKNGK